jgi:hypothetical protein
MKYKFDISSKPNRLAFALGVSIIVGTLSGKLQQKKVCTTRIGSQNLEIKCGEFKKDWINPRAEMVSYKYNLTSALVYGSLTFGVLLVLNGFVKNQE